MRHTRATREEATRLRSSEGLSLNELSERLGVSKSTIRYWVKDVPPPSLLSAELKAQRAKRQAAYQQAGTAAMQAKYASMRHQAYTAAYEKAAELLKDLLIRDFVVLYLAEGYRKQPNSVALSNSNPQIIQFAHAAMRRLATNTHFYYSFQYHADQNPDELRCYWGAYLNIDPGLIHAIPKTNSGRLAGRRFTCKYGVFQLQVSDTLFRSRLQALMDVVQEQWQTKNQNNE
jgi:transcriptional regulator with XRE-family HTH domain